MVLSLPLGSSAFAEDIAIIVRDDFPLENTTLYELKNIYGNKNLPERNQIKPHRPTG